MIKKLLDNKELTISLIIIGLLIFVIYASFSFLSAIFGAIILSFIFSPINDFFINKLDISKKISVGMIIMLVIIMIIIPSFILVNGLIIQIKLLPSQLDKVEIINKEINSIFPFEINIDKEMILKQILSISGRLITPILNNIFQMLLMVFIMLFLMYYFIMYNREIKKKIYDSLPFSHEYKERIIKKFNEVTYSAIIGTFLIALLQGFLISLNFYLLGIPNALFWGFVTIIFSILPVLGPPFIWIPAAIIMYLLGSPEKSIVLIIVGIMIYALENILRPVLNLRFGKIHPVISVLGVFVGISQFGLIGIFIGPLILSYLILFWEIYRENYLNKK